MNDKAMGALTKTIMKNKRSPTHPSGLETAAASTSRFQARWSPSHPVGYQTLRDPQSSEAYRRYPPVPQMEPNLFLLTVAETKQRNGSGSQRDCFFTGEIFPTCPRSRCQRFKTPVIEKLRTSQLPPGLVRTAVTGFNSFQRSPAPPCS